MLNVTRAEYDHIASLPPDEKDAELRRIMQDRAPEYLAQLDAELVGELAKPPGNFRGTRVFMNIRDAGAYEKRIGEDGKELHSGVCAQCAEKVNEGDPFVILYHDYSRAGGIFHEKCRPTSSGWYDPSDAGEALGDG